MNFEKLAEFKADFDGVIEKLKTAEEEYLEKLRGLSSELLQARVYYEDAQDRLSKKYGLRPDDLPNVEIDSRRYNTVKIDY